MKIAWILVIVFFCCGCSILPENLTIQEGFSLNKAREIMEALEAKPSGKGLVSELYFDVTDDSSVFDSTDWYILPDNTQLGLYSTEIKNSATDTKIPGKPKNYKIKQILLGEINQGYKGKLKWDMQIKTFFKALNLENHLENNQNQALEVGKIEVGDLFYQAVEKLKSTCASDSQKTHDYIEMPNHIFRWVQLENNMTLEILGESKATSGEFRIVQIRICNSTELFKIDAESWYNVQSIHYSSYGVRLWGIDVETSYFNIFIGLQLQEAIETLKLAEVREMNLNSDDLKKIIQRIKQRKTSITSTDISFRKFRLKNNINLTIGHQQLLEGAYDTITYILLEAKVPKLSEVKTKQIQLECEFLDLVKPLRADWFEKLVK